MKTLEDIRRDRIDKIQSISEIKMTTTEVYRYSYRYNGIYKLVTCNGAISLEHTYVDGYEFNRFAESLMIDCDTSTEELHSIIMNKMVQVADADETWVDVCGSAFSNLTYGDELEDTISEWNDFKLEIHSLFKDELKGYHISYTMPVSFRKNKGHNNEE